MVTRPFVIALMVLAAGLVTTGGRVRACSLNGNDPYSIDPQARSADTSPPGMPIASVQTIKRGKGPEQHGRSQSASWCDDLGRIVVKIGATDDQTPAEELGYRIELVSGDLPSGLTLPATAVRPASAHELLFAWGDGRSDDQEALAFVLSIRAVDKAGNEGSATSVEVRDAASGGCSVAGRRSAADRAAALAMVLLVGALLRERYWAQESSQGSGILPSGQ